MIRAAIGAALLACALFLGGCQTQAPPGAGTFTTGDTTVTVGGSVSAETGIVR